MRITPRTVRQSSNGAAIVGGLFAGLFGWIYGNLENGYHFWHMEDALKSMIGAAILWGTNKGFRRFKLDDDEIHATEQSEN